MDDTPTADREDDFPRHRDLRREYLEAGKSIHPHDYQPTTFEEDVALLFVLFENHHPALLTLLTEYGVDYIITSAPYMPEDRMSPIEAIAMSRFLDHVVPALATDRETYLPLTDFVRGLCHLSHDLKEHLISMEFVETYFVPRFEDEDPRICHNSLRIARYVWRYQARGMFGKSLEHRNRVIQLVDGTNIVWKCQASDIMYILRDFTDSAPMDEEFFRETICSFMANIVSSFNSRRIRLRVCKTILRLLPRYPMISSHIQNEAFFHRLIDDFISAPEHRADKFPPHFFLLLANVIQSMGQDAGMTLFHSIPLESYFHIFRNACSETSQECLSLVSFICRHNPEDARYFQSAAALLADKWICHSTECPRPRAAVWVHFCHTLLMYFGPEVVVSLLSVKVIEATCRAVDPEWSRPYTMDLIFLMIDASAKLDLLPRVLSALSAIEALVEEISDLSEMEPDDRGDVILEDTERCVNLVEEARVILEKLSDWDGSDK
jgi:hypothetical protein